MIWAGPKFDPAAEVLDLLADYLRGGGAVAAFFGPDTPPAVRLWTEQFNVRQRDDVVVAPNRAGAYAGVGLRTVTVIDGYTEHPAVRSLKGNATTFPLVQTLGSVRRTRPASGARSSSDRPRHLVGNRPGAPATPAPRLSIPAATGAVRPPSEPPCESHRRAPRPGTAADGRLTLIGSSAFVTNANICSTPTATWPSTWWAGSPPRRTWWASAAVAPASSR